jgi:hypothetical protein
MSRRVRFAAIVGAALTLLASPVPSAFARQQPPAAQPSGQVGDQPVAPAELQRLFDSYALVQAQRFFGMSDEQYAKFLPRFMALQDARRRGQQQRNRVLNVIRRLLMEGQSDDQIKGAIKQLQDIDDRTAAETRKAEDAVDQVLEVPQQGRFRIFEEQMERSKLDMVTRARQANQANRPNRGR